jgi:hypothetical protein
MRLPRETREAIQMTTTFRFDGVAAMSPEAPALLISDAFKGITSDRNIVPGLFPAEKTGVPATSISDYLLLV